ncbi:MAG: HupE/UreJ family protein [Bryobacterales bacterium]|nr:HupE/UreJ family protein [Bryobacterales bacterium]
MPTENHRAFVLLFLLVAGLWVGPRCRAHEIPADIYTTVFVKQEAQRLRILVRVPLAAVRDFVYPEQPDGYLDFDKLAEQLPSLAQQWIAQGMEVHAEGVTLPAPAVTATQLSVASDRAFMDYESALDRVSAPLPGNDIKVVWNQLWFDVLLDYAVEDSPSRYTIRTGFERLAMRVSVALRFLPQEGGERVYSLHMDGGSGDTDALPLDPRWHQAAGRFIGMGFEHILEGIDHLLFLCCLVIPLRRLKPLVLVVTAFTVAHSITLLAAAAGYVPDGLWFPPLVETLIALTIVWMAVGNVVGAVAGTPLNPKGKPLAESWHSRWKLAFGFGLIHGLGFSFALRESLQFAGSHLATSLVAFNVGVELGQVAVLLVLAPLLTLLFRTLVSEGIGVIVLSALIAHTGWHWMLERGDALLAFVPAIQMGTVPDAATLMGAAGSAFALLTVIQWARNYLGRTPR